MKINSKNLSDETKKIHENNKNLCQAKIILHQGFHPPSAHYFYIRMLLLFYCSTPFYFHVFKCYLKKANIAQIENEDLYLNIFLNV